MSREFGFINPRDKTASVGFLLERLDDLSKQDLDDLVAIFNQEKIHKLFSNIPSEKISRDKVLSILNFYCLKQKPEEIFLFLIRNSNNKIVAGIDLQKERERVYSIGFWSDLGQKGFISGAITSLKENLNSLNIIELNAYTELKNQEAILTLTRNNFEKVTIVKGKSGKSLIKFSNKL